MAVVERSGGGQRKKRQGLVKVKVKRVLFEKIPLTTLYTYHCEFSGHCAEHEATSTMAPFALFAVETISIFGLR